RHRLDQDPTASQPEARAKSSPPLWKARVLHFAGAMIVACCMLGGLLQVAPFNRRKTAALLSYALVPVLLAFFVSRISQSIYLNRAFIATAPIIPILLAAPIAF